MSIEAMNRMIEALTNCQTVFEAAGCVSQEIEDAIQDGKQAIVEAEKQEPYGYFRYDMRLDAWVQNRDSNTGVAFYTTPPAAQRQWVGLTDERIETLWQNTSPYYDHQDFARSIEAAHGIKENT